MNKKVNEYIKKQKSPQKEILKKVRKIILKTLPDCEENIAWGVITFANNKFYIAALKDKVHIGFVITGLSKKDVNYFEGSGKIMRHIKIYSLKDIDEKKLIKLIKIVNKKAVCNPCKKFN